MTSNIQNQPNFTPYGSLAIFVSSVMELTDAFNAGEKEVASYTRPTENTQTTDANEASTQYTIDTYDAILMRHTKSLSDAAQNLLQLIIHETKNKEASPNNDLFVAKQNRKNVKNALNGLHQLAFDIAAVIIDEQKTTELLKQLHEKEITTSKTNQLIRLFVEHLQTV